MNDIGMLWSIGASDSGLPIEMNIYCAADHYRTKYQAEPTICFVHPSIAQTDIGSIPGMRVLTSGRLKENQIWLGV